jgi:hypothetical protein
MARNGSSQRAACGLWVLKAVFNEEVVCSDTGACEEGMQKLLQSLSVLRVQIRD